MTNKYDNWARLLMVIERSGKSINAFAMEIGLSRAENLYHIRRGNYGISDDLADRIIRLDPEIDRTWLLSGVGSMLKSEVIAAETVPFYIDDIKVVLPNLLTAKPVGSIQLPYNTHCDIAVRSFSKSMSETISASHDLFLKRIDITEVVQGNEYVFWLDQPKDNVLWRKLRLIANEDTKWRLVARNREQFADIIIDKSQVLQVWRVIARLTVLES